MGRGPGDMPLAGVKVLEFARVAAGPFASLILADLGAEVIKLEPPGGDDSRHMDASHDHGMSGYYFGLNRSKRAVLVDLKSGEGLALARRLAREADVVIENYRAGKADELGVGYQDLAALNSRLIYCSISGFGLEGPLSSRPAYDLIVQAISGLMDITGADGGEAAKAGPPIMDMACGMMAALGVMTALYRREVTGAGEKVETSLLGAGLMLMAAYVPSRALGTKFERVGSAHNTLAPYQCFYGSDGKGFVLACGNDSFFRRLIQVIGRDDLAGNSAYASNGARVANRRVLAEELQQTFSTRPASEWMELLDGKVPISWLYTIDDVIAEPHYRLNGYVADVDDPALGKVPVIRTPLTFSGAPLAEGLEPPPVLDANGAEVRAGGGFRLAERKTRDAAKPGQ